ncbi:MAG: protein kinase, partial [Deltaproteobacteria bacterium]|nr:protein kinase [Deltaproteobacteria bacterium]
MLGATLNKRYALEQLLAKGESGSLYLATDTATGEMLAARVFSSGVRLGDENGLRFLRVMTLLAGVRHPNLLLPVETGSAAGLGPDELTYQITPYYPAPSLEQAMRELPFSLKEGVALLRQAALGLDALHQAGVVHGNLKPSNILVSREGDHLSAVVLDPARGLLAAPLAGAGQLAHAVWMAPEETGWGPRGCDDRSDLYRLGLLGYRVMTGRLPFAGNTPHQMAQHHLATMPPSPREINGVIPPRLAAILLKLLAKNPVDRYQTARGLLADLDLWDQPPELPLATRDTPPRFPLAGPVTGREGAGEALLAALERARSGQGGGLVVLSGESGQGKRSLFQSL